jgi:hypothetical protein
MPVPDVVGVVPPIPMFPLENVLPEELIVKLAVPDVPIKNP